jgi:hypothetical protein
VCADTCAEYAISEEQIASTPDLCGSTAAAAINQIRADFTNCALPANSLTTSCIHGVQNEPNNCGFSENLGSLCSYCAASSPNATDSCCLYSKTETRCQNVRLPITTSMGPIFTSTATATPTSSASVSNKSSGLSGGAIAGIVIGSVLGALLLLALIIGCCILARRRRESQHAGSFLNQPSPTRQGPGPGPGPAPAPAMSYTSSNRPRQQEEILPAGARVHHMAALEGPSSSNGEHSSPIAGGGYSSGYDDSPESQRSGLGVTAPKRGGSMPSDGSPTSREELSSPEGLASGQSEQMSHFKDYYSQEEIRPNDAVAVLWAYQPRANDEWELERGDMIKVVGIWDDGWATGVKLRQRAEEWEARNANRDSGVSNGSRPLSAEVVGDGEIKAFPVSSLAPYTIPSSTSSSTWNQSFLVPSLNIADCALACMRMPTAALAQDDRRRYRACREPMTKVDPIAFAFVFLSLFYTPLRRSPTSCLTTFRRARAHRAALCRANHKSVTRQSDPRKRPVHKRRRRRLFSLAFCLCIHTTLFSQVFVLQFLQPV